MWGNSTGARPASPTALCFTKGKQPQLPSALRDRERSFAHKLSAGSKPFSGVLSIQLLCKTRPVCDWLPLRQHLCDCKGTKWFWDCRLSRRLHVCTVQLSPALWEQHSRHIHCRQQFASRRSEQALLQRLLAQDAESWREPHQHVSPSAAKEKGSHKESSFVPLSHTWLFNSYCKTLHQIIARMSLFPLSSNSGWKIAVFEVM